MPSHVILLWRKPSLVGIASRSVAREFKRGGEVTSAAFSPNGEFLVVGSKDKTAAIYEIASGSVAREFEIFGPVSSVAFSPNGEFLVVGFEGLVVN